VSDQRRKPDGLVADLSRLAELRAAGTLSGARRSPTPKARLLGQASLDRVQVAAGDPPPGETPPSLPSPVAGCARPLPSPIRDCAGLVDETVGGPHHARLALRWLPRRPRTKWSSPRSARFRACTICGCDGLACSLPVGRHWDHVRLEDVAVASGAERRVKSRTQTRPGHSEPPRTPRRQMLAPPRRPGSRRRPERPWLRQTRDPCPRRAYAIHHSARPSGPPCNRRATQLPHWPAPASLLLLLVQGGSLGRPDRSVNTAEISWLRQCFCRPGGA
jgi:hypothetical protein